MTQELTMAETHTLGKDLKVGDLAYGRMVVRLKFYMVPAKILHSYYAEKHPEGLPSWLADLGPDSEHGPLGITIFHHDYIPKDGPK